MLRFRDFGVFVFDLGCFACDLGVFVFEFWVLCFRDLGALFSRFGCSVLRSSFSSASFSNLPLSKVNIGPQSDAKVSSFAMLISSDLICIIR